MEELVTAFDNLFSKDYNAFIRREMPEERSMKNFIFISPNFPENYWRFCAALRERGLRVLGVGDCPYDGLSEQLRCILDEYYYVSSLEHYDEVYGAVAYFAFKYGKPDWLESNNEYWLERDARLREDFNITSGFRPKDMPPVKLKSRMKERYRLAGIPVARYCLADSYDTCRDFLREVGRAVVKPDNGVGANATYPISCEADLVTFFSGKHEGYIMEEYIDGTICSYDAIVDENGVPVFETGNVTPASLMDIVNERRESMFYIVKELPEKLREMGRAAVKSFGVKSRFVHFEFFRLNRDCVLGKEGDYTALEVNMRPSGGCSPDMMNYANATDVYARWADMIAGVTSPVQTDKKCFCAFVGRRNGKHYALSREEILIRYGSHMKEHGEVDAALAPAMGDERFIACFDTEKEVYAFFRETTRIAD